MSLDCFSCFEEGGVGIWMFVFTEVVAEGNSVVCAGWVGQFPVYR